MCGRTACTLGPDAIQKACCYKNPKTKKYQKPEWRNVSNGGRTYRPSYNVCPTDVTPVLLSGSHFNVESSRILQPMLWGLISPWHKGDLKDHKLKTNNCRIENLESSKLYKTPFIKGQRCVILCDGFYEWQTTKGKNLKQPYYIYMPQDEGVKIEEPETWSYDFDDDFGWKGPKLLRMAGIFDIWRSTEGEEIFSYTVITMEANSSFSWLHHRMPAILESDEEISAWLDSGEVDYKKALSLIKPTQALLWHPVSNLVNNSRNKDAICNKPVKEGEESIKKDIKNEKLAKSANFMKAWLQGSTTKRASSNAKEGSEAKVTKKENEFQ